MQWLLWHAARLAMTMVCLRRLTFGCLNWESSGTWSRSRWTNDCLTDILVTLIRGLLSIVLQRVCFLLALAHPKYCSNVDRQPSDNGTRWMSAGGAWGGARGLQPRAPEKGVFPLDHFGECKQVCTLLALRPSPAPTGPRVSATNVIAGASAISYVQRGAEQVKDEYLACLKQHQNNAEECREVAKLYLACRMERCRQRRSYFTCREHHHNGPFSTHGVVFGVGTSWPNRISASWASEKHHQMLQHPLRLAVRAAAHSLCQEEGSLGTHPRCARGPGSTSVIMRHGCPHGRAGSSSHALRLQAPRQAEMTAPLDCSQTLSLCRKLSPQRYVKEHLLRIIKNR